MIRRPPISTLTYTPFPDTTRFRSNPARCARRHREMRKTMSPRLLMLAIAPVLLAASEPGEADPLAGAQTVSDEVLAAQRGGFAFQGMVIAFGADIRSYVNDELALRTIVSWTRSEEHTSELPSLMRI